MQKTENNVVPFSVSRLFIKNVPYAFLLFTVLERIVNIPKSALTL